MSDDNKVVPFPAHKVRKSTQTAPTPETQDSLSQKRKATLVVSLVATVIIATMLNSRLNSTLSDLTSNSRSIASATNSSNQDFNEDILLAKKIARESLRQPASRGREPTKEEVLQFEILKGAYILERNAVGALVSIDYVRNGGEIRKLPDRKKFLKDNEDLLKLEFDVSDLENSTGDDKFQYELYFLKKNTETIGKVHFTFDREGHLISMKVESKI